MKNKYAAIFVQILIMAMFMFVNGCSNAEYKSDETKHASLTIGIFGKTPGINDRNVRFKKVNLKDLNRKMDDHLAGLFIMPDRLIQAAKDSTPIYIKNCLTPLFLSVLKSLIMCLQINPYLMKRESP
jgi:hypothetical protein